MASALNGGIQALFGAAFGGLYLNATLYGGGRYIYDGAGNIIGYDEGEQVCKAQVDAVDWAMRQEGYVDGDVKIIILSQGLSRPVNADHQIAVQADRFAIEGGGYQRWSLSGIAMDAAGSHFVCRGRKA